MSRTRNSQGKFITPDKTFSLDRPPRIDLSEEAQYLQQEDVVLRSSRKKTGAMIHQTTSMSRSRDSYSPLRNTRATSQEESEEIQRACDDVYFNSKILTWTAFLLYQVNRAAWWILLLFFAKGFILDPSFAPFVFSLAICLFSKEEGSCAKSLTIAFPVEKLANTP